jgi:hypothetical protein
MVAAGVHANAVAAARDDLNAILHPAVGGSKVHLGPGGEYYGDPFWVSQANHDLAIINGTQD